jgi:hypothetical protein
MKLIPTFYTNFYCVNFLYIIPSISVFVFFLLPSSAIAYFAISVMFAGTPGYQAGGPYTPQTPGTMYGSDQSFSPYQPSPSPTVYNGTVGDIFYPYFTLIVAVSLLYSGYCGPFPGAKAWPGHDADHSPPSSAKVENE